jgi:hypothetical protein
LVAMATAEAKLGQPDGLVNRPLMNSSRQPSQRAAGRVALVKLNK